MALSKEISPVAADWSARRWTMRDGCSSVEFAMAARGEGKHRDFDPPFGEFARGVIAHLDHSRREVPSRGVFDTAMLALRCLHASLDADGVAPAGPAGLLPCHLDAAMAGIRASRSNNGNVAHAASMLRYVVSLVEDHELADVGAMDWVPTLLDLEDNAVGQPSLDVRQIEAIAALSMRDDLPYFDRLRRSLFEIELFTGFRAAEGLTLPADAWVGQERMDDNGDLVLAPDGRPALNHGVRYWPRKGDDDALIKPLLTATAPVVTRAIERALELTADARAVAAYQFAHPGSTTLGAPWDDLPDDGLLSDSNVATALGLKDSAASRAFLKRRKVPLVKTEEPGRGGNPTRYHVRKADLYRALYAHSDRKPPLPSIPSIPLHALCFVVHRNSKGDSPGIRGTAMLLRRSRMDEFLMGNGGTFRSIFERLDLAVEGVRVHQCRVTLGTMAMALGLPEMVTARWMGRKTVAAAADYDRRTGAEIAAALREKLEEAGEFAPQPTHTPLPLQDGEHVLEVGATAHATGIGLCHHEYADAPCEHHRKLVEAGYDAGWDPRDEAGAIARVVAQVERQLAQDEAAVAAGYAGAAAWVEARRRELEGLRQPLARFGKDSETADAGQDHR